MKFSKVFKLTVSIRQDKDIMFTDLLFLLFFGLWLSDVITWNWFYVFSPLFFPFVLSFFTLLIEQRANDKHIKSMTDEEIALKEKEGVYSWEKIANDQAEEVKEILKDHKKGK